MEPVVVSTSLCTAKSHRSVTVCLFSPSYTRSFRKAWKRFSLNFVLENFRKIRLSCFNFQLHLVVLVTILHAHARHTGSYTH
jgi:hypothetical protein